MIRLAVPIILLLLMLLGGTWVFVGSLEGPEAPASRHPRKSAKPRHPRSSCLASAPRPQSPARARRRLFDVARMTPRAPRSSPAAPSPGTSVTVMGDGKALGTAQADENGEWSLATEREARERRSQARIENEVAARSRRSARSRRGLQRLSPTDADPAGGALRRRRDRASPEGPRRHGEGRAHDYAASRRRCRHGGARRTSRRRLRRASPACTSPCPCRSHSSSTRRS